MLYLQPQLITCACADIYFTKITKSYSESCQTPSKMELSAKIVIGQKLLTIPSKISILDVWEGSQYVYGEFLKISEILEIHKNFRDT